MTQESGGNEAAVSDAGAIGLMQLMPATARGLGVDPKDPKRNIEGGVKYLGQLMKKYDGNIGAVLANYNGGPGVAKQYLAGTTMNKETTGVVKAVMGNYGRYEAAMKYDGALASAAGAAPAAGALTVVEEGLPPLPPGKRYETPQEQLKRETAEGLVHPIEKLDPRYATLEEQHAAEIEYSKKTWKEQERQPNAVKLEHPVLKLDRRNAKVVDVTAPVTPSATVAAGTAQAAPAAALTWEQIDALPEGERIKYIANMRNTRQK
jgi:hypothetical protein